MSTDKPVIVYGASGYTGRLVCEYLREFGIPFIAAGLDKARIAEALETVPGIDTVDHEIVEVAHAVEPLTELFDGARVVCNMVGPFAQHGGEVVEACLATGAHYLDTTGEQDWLIAAGDTYGQRMASKIRAHVRHQEGWSSTSGFWSESGAPPRSPSSVADFSHAGDG